MNSYLASFLIALAVTAITTPIIIKIASKIGAMDIPMDDRRMHAKPVPYLGGVAIYLGIMAAFLYRGEINQQLLGLTLGSTMILILGVIDDIKGLRARTKLVGQIACAAVLYFNTVQIRGMANFLPWGPRYINFPGVVAFLVTVLWVVGITNTINLIDGLDGLAAGISCISCMAVAYTAALTDRMGTCLIMLAVTGATLGFLLYNFYPAKIFMGDAGAMLLGYLLAGVSLIGDKPTKSTTLFATIIPILILAIPIFDTTFAIVRRMASRKPIMQADKGHLHHRIMAMGFGQRRTVLALYCISAIMGVAGIMWTMDMRLECAVLALIAATLITIFLGIGSKPREEECEAPAQPLEPEEEYESCAFNIEEVEDSAEGGERIEAAAYENK
ncbi:MAG: undecaprenyl/decaprenyl-phosphate alpha-N-acetylglucosaminyl 1-phosphate transferase [Clostridiales bacterium]|nr:undecaprenyl/decaprenyl-phosphate alpha-N-acetylglucosaminyl 1-phosphate transferase [Clostridiales bacterium]